MARGGKCAAAWGERRLCEEKDASKKSHGGVHHRKSSNASADGSHGFLPGLLRKVGGSGSHDLKEKDGHAAESNLSSHGSHGGHGFLPGLLKKAGFGSQEFKDKDGHAPEHARTGSGLKGGGSQEVKPGDEEGQHHHRRHGTRDKELFGFEDADENNREHGDVFGFRDTERPHNLEKENSLFGYEDKEFERGEKGRDLFGDDDPDTQSFREKLNIVGAPDGAGDEDTRQVFGDENTEDSDEDVGSGDDPKRPGRHGRPASD